MQHTDAGRWGFEGCQIAGWYDRQQYRECDIIQLVEVISSSRPTEYVVDVNDMKRFISPHKYAATFFMAGFTLACDMNKRRYNVLDESSVRVC